MGKYIVELKKNETLYKAATRESDGTAYVCSAIGTPCTEPDLEQVRKEAYDTAYADAEEIYENGKKAMYQKGLKDAWEAARKIQDTGGNLSWWIHNVSPSEAIEKIRQYEQGKIKIGDEVENIQTGVKFTVTHLWKNNRGEQGVSGFSQECSAFSTTLSLVVKTGRHFPEVAAIFDKMRGE